MERRIRPIRNAQHLPVFDRIEVDVVDVPAQIAFIADQVFPVPALPDAAFPSGHALRATPLLRWQAARKARLDLGPSVGIVSIAGRQSPYAMQVLGKHDNRQHLEGPHGMRGVECNAKVIDPIHQQPTTTFQKIHREEIGAPGTRMRR